MKRECQAVVSEALGRRITPEDAAFYENKLIAALRADAQDRETWNRRSFAERVRAAGQRVAEEMREKAQQETSDAFDADKSAEFSRIDAEITDRQRTIAAAQRVAGEDEGATKYGSLSLTLPGGENYSELLLTLPASDDNFKSDHWREPNVLAHVRFDERVDAEGRRILFVQEIQSDWHQMGRRKGYRAPDLADRIAAIDAKAGAVMSKRVGKSKDDPGYAEALAEWQDLQRQRSELAKQSFGAPDAPFKASWPELVLKRMVRWAAENGFEGVAWTTGDMQNVRNEKEDSPEAFRQFYDVNLRNMANAIGKKAGAKVETTTISVGSAEEKATPWLVLDSLHGTLLERHATEADAERAAERFHLEEDRVDDVAVVEDIHAGDHVVPFLPLTRKLRDQALSGLPLFQGVAGDVGRSTRRGSILFSFDDNMRLQKATIELTEATDASTFLHEGGHLFLEILRMLASDADANPQMRADWETVRDWLGMSDDSVSPNVEQHELWARTFEAYLREGKAPSLSLKRIFEAFREWLMRIYQALRLDHNLTPEIRDVMDRMFASDAEIAEAKQKAGQGRLFASRDDFPGTDAAWARYQEQIQRAEEEAKADLMADAMAAFYRKKTAWYGRALAEKRRAAMRDYDSQPARRAHDWLAYGVVMGETEDTDNSWGPVDAPDGLPPMRLKRSAVVDEYPEIAPALPREVLNAGVDENQVDELTNRAMDVKRGLRAKGPTRLAAFVRAKGGVNDDRGDIASIAGGANRTGGLVNKNSRHSLDDMARMAWEEGFFGVKPGRQAEFFQRAPMGNYRAVLILFSEATPAKDAAVMLGMTETAYRQNVSQRRMMARQLIDGGASVDAVAAKWGLDVDVIEALLDPSNKHQFTRRPEVEQAFAMLAERDESGRPLHSYAEIGAAVGRSEHSIKQLVSNERKRPRPHPAVMANRRAPDLGDMKDIIAGLQRQLNFREIAEALNAAGRKPPGAESYSQETVRTRVRTYYEAVRAGEIAPVVSPGMEGLIWRRSLALFAEGLAPAEIAQVLEEQFHDTSRAAISVILSQRRKRVQAAKARGQLDHVAAQWGLHPDVLEALLDRSKMFAQDRSGPNARMAWLVKTAQRQANGELLPYAAIAERARAAGYENADQNWVAVYLNRARHLGFNIPSRTEGWKRKTQHLDQRAMLIRVESVHGRADVEVGAGSRDMRRMLGEQRRAGELVHVRWMIDRETGETYMWPGAHMWHADVAKQLGLPLSRFERGGAATSAEVGEFEATRAEIKPAPNQWRLDQDDGRPSVRQFLDALDADLKGEGVYRLEDENDVWAAEELRELRHWLETRGVDLAGDRAAIKRQVADALAREGSEEDGVHPDVAASYFGFDNGAALLKAIAALPPRRQAIEQAAEAAMRAEHGDPFADGKLKEEALAVAHKAAASRVLELELEALDRATGGLQRPLQKAARKIALEQLAQMTVRQIRGYDKYLHAERRFGARAEEAMARGDKSEAALAKKQQLIAFHLYAQARAASEEMDVLQVYLSRFNKSAKRQTIDQTQLDQIDQILEQFDIRKTTPGQEQRAMNLRQWVEWMHGQGYGRLVAIDPRRIDDARRRPFAQLTLDEARGLRDTIKNLEHLGWLKDKLLVAREEREIQAIADAMIARMQKEGPLDAGGRANFSPSAKEKADEWRRSVHAEHTRPEFLFRLMDGLKDNGPVWRNLFRPLAEAEAAELEMGALAAERLAELFSVYSKKELALMFSKREVFPSIGRTITKSELLSMALNWGNAYNKQVLLESYQWNEQQVWQAFNERLDKRDWDFVQGVWDFLETYKEPRFALHERMTGVRPEAVEATPVQTRFGAYRGGYYHVDYDPNQSELTFKRDAKQQMLDDIGGHFVRPNTKQGALQQRTNRNGQKMRIDLAVLHEQVTEAIHDITHREAVIDTLRLIERPEVQEAIIRSVGREQYRMLQPWLQGIAVSAKQPQTDWERILSRVRNGSSVVNMGWKLSTAIVQPLGILGAVPRVGLRPLAAMVAKFYGRPDLLPERLRFALDRSTALRFRMQTFDRDVNDALASARGKIEGDLVPLPVRRSFFFFTGLMDMGVAVPVWLTAYEAARAGKVDGVAGGDEQAAIQHADSVVRMTQGSGGAKDLAEVMRGPQIRKLWTQFYSYFSVLYNQLWTEQFPGVALGKIPLPVFVANLAFLWFGPALLAQMLQGGLEPRDGEDDDDRNRRVALATAAYPLMTVIGVRDFVNAATSGYGYEVTPAAEGIDRAASVLGAAGEGDFDDGTLKDAMLASGYWFGLPSRQAWITFDYVRDAIEGRERPIEDPASMWSEGLMQDSR